MIFIPRDVNGVCVVSFQIHVCSLETGKPVVCVGGSPGDFTCINLRDAPPHLLVCGNKDRRWGESPTLTRSQKPMKHERILLFETEDRTWMWTSLASLRCLHKNFKSTNENRILIEMPPSICLFCWKQRSTSELLHETKKSICVPIKWQQTHLSVSTQCLGC